MSENLIFEVHRHHVLRTLTKLVSTVAGAQNVVVTNRGCTHGRNILAATSNVIEFKENDEEYKIEVDFEYLDTDNNEDHRMFNLFVHTAPGCRLGREIQELDLFSEKSEYRVFSQWLKSILTKYKSKVAVSEAADLLSKQK